MEITVRVSKDRKCPASLNWRQPERGIAGWILSFGDPDKPRADCEIAFNVFQLRELQKMINKVDINSLGSTPEIKRMPKPLGILVKVAEEYLPCPTGEKSTYLEGLIASVSKDKEKNCWLLSFYEYNTTAPDKKEGDFNIWVQIEFSSIQLAELKGVLNTLFAKHKKEHDDWVKRNAKRNA